MVPGVMVYDFPVSWSVSSASPSTQTTASMWFAYHIDVSVPAYRIVSCREKPTFSLARTMRLLSHVPDADFTCRSVPSISLNERTITVLRCLLNGVVPVARSGGLADGAGQCRQALVQFLGRDGQGGEQFHDLA